MSSGGLAFVKGHGTENDFVLIPDLDGRLALTDAQVAAICDRRAGIGGDGILRVVATDAEPAAAAYRGAARWFMDYRNADGSVAEMCGNGIRVFARYLVEQGLEAPGEFPIATRGGVRSVRCPADGPITVDMGAPIRPDLGEITVQVGERSWPAQPVFMPNPHAVVFVDDLAQAGDLRTPPLVSPAEAYPEGVNVEFVVRVGPGHLALRVHERGSGETRSCGTGICAAAVAAGLQGVPNGYVVDVPGGRLEITETAAGSVLMTGPAVLVAAGEWHGDNGWSGGASAWDASVRTATAVGTGSA
jgi:diaminopimelate epimerase